MAWLLKRMLMSDLHVLVYENDAVTLTITWNQAMGGVMFVLVLASALPSMVVAWQDSGEYVDID